MSAKPWAQVAQLISSQGLKGKFAARSVRGLPFFLEPEMEVRFVPPLLKGPRCAHVESVEQASGGDWRVSFREIRSREAADALAGSFCLVKREGLPEGFEQMGAYGWQFIGCDVIDEAYGLLGQVVEVTQMPTQDLLVVNGSFGEVMIPVVDEFVLSADPEEGRIETAVPLGLLDLSGQE